MSNISIFRNAASATPTASTGSATRLDVLRLRAQEAVGGWLTRLGVPGAVQPWEYTDALTGQHVQVRTSALFTILTINGRDYYFSRLTGRFDGTGQMV